MRLSVIGCGFLGAVHPADPTYVNATVDALLPYLSSGDIVAGKSTVPVGKAAALASRIESAGAKLVWHPEFLREGWAVHDTLHPDRLVVGVAPTTAGASAAETLREAYAAPLAEGAPYVVTDLATSELVKVTANALLVTKISFINAMAEIAEVGGADVRITDPQAIENARRLHPQLTYVTDRDETLRDVDAVIVVTE